MNQAHEPISSGAGGPRIERRNANAVHMMLTRGDRRKAERLWRECTSTEDADTWLPMFSSCNICKGYVFQNKTDIQRQLGACGCLIALEMEIASVPFPAAKASLA